MNTPLRKRSPGLSPYVPTPRATVPASGGDLEFADPPDTDPESLRIAPLLPIPATHSTPAAAPAIGQKVLWLRETDAASTDQHPKDEASFRPRLRVRAWERLHDTPIHNTRERRVEENTARTSFVSPRRDVGGHRPAVLPAAVDDVPRFMRPTRNSASRRATTAPLPPQSSLRLTFGLLRPGCPELPAATVAKRARDVSRLLPLLSLAESAGPWCAVNDPGKDVKFLDIVPCPTESQSPIHVTPRFPDANRSSESSSPSMHDHPTAAEVAAAFESAALLAAALPPHPKRDDSLSLEDELPCAVPPAQLATGPQFRDRDSCAPLASLTAASEPETPRLQHWIASQAADQPMVIKRAQVPLLRLHAGGSSACTPPPSVRIDIPEGALHVL